jgi:hypothetical protein
MKVGYLNGLPSVSVPGGTIRILRVEEPSVATLPGIVLEAQEGERQLWRTKVTDIMGDPTSVFTDSQYEDYAALFWESGFCFVVAGASKAVLVDLATGEVRREYKLRFLGRSSLDLLQLRLTPEGDQLVIASSRRLVVLNWNLQPILDYTPPGPIAKVEAVHADGISVGEYDVDDPECPLVTKRVSW